MIDKKEDSKNQVLEEGDLKNELSALVDQKIISLRIAEKLENKLKEKKVKINKEQLNTLAYKIRDVLKDYTKTSKIVGKPTWEKSDADMQKLLKTIENLEGRITNIESEKISDLNIVTTEDIQISPKEWKLDPLKEVPSDPQSVIVLMKWLQYLIDKCGRDNLTNILDYYVDIGWISQNAKISYTLGVID